MGGGGGDRVVRREESGQRALEGGGGVEVGGGKRHRMKVKLQTGKTNMQWEGTGEKAGRKRINKPIQEIGGRSYAVSSTHEPTHFLVRVAGG